MTEISNNQNLNAHYTTNAKAQRSTNAVASAPVDLPKHHLFSDKDANNRMKAISYDIYQDSKKEENRHAKNFSKVFGGGVLAILAILGLKKVFKKS